MHKELIRFLMIKDFITPEWNRMGKSYRKSSQDKIYRKKPKLKMPGTIYMEKIPEIGPEQ